MIAWLTHLQQRRIWAANEYRKVTALLPCARSNRIASPPLNSEITRFQIEEQGLGNTVPKALTTRLSFCVNMGR
jgi:hypothetical protein